MFVLMVEGENVRFYVSRRYIAVQMTRTRITYKGMASLSGVFLSRRVTVTVHTVHVCTGRKEEHVLFNDALNTFYLRLYGVGHVVKDHSDSK